ncbi:hypothetical protein J6500_01230 [Bradyrhizobium sp. WSM 1704]|nr:hypothetical protein [Bradyrhizobium semiaridum]MCA6120529.1 hypothetical protein [Bradyrhizobium semiaridum]
MANRIAEDRGLDEALALGSEVAKRQVVDIFIMVSALFRWRDVPAIA